MIYTEKEKMMAGEPYDTRDPELLEMYHKARKLMKVFNNLDSTDSIGKRKTLVELLGFIGEGVWIEPPFLCDYGENISIGENTLINTNCMFIDDKHHNRRKKWINSTLCTNLYSKASIKSG